MPKRTIQIAITDDKYEPLFKTISEFVNERYHFELTKKKDALYVFHSASGHEVLKYSGIRIFATGEMISPDFNTTDYAMGFDKMTYGDRYLWLPLIRLYHNVYQSFISPRADASAILNGKSDFCAYVMSNTANSAPERTQIYDLISRYKTISSGGSWRNNVGGRVDDKIAFQSKHKFVVAFENMSFPGYLTEKFSEAAASQAIPIYWGDSSIGEIFNPKAFINCHDYPTLEDAVAKMIELDQNDEAYLQMLSEPWFANATEPACFSQQHCAAFLSHIFEQPLAKAFRRPLGRWAIKYERALYRAVFRPHEQLIKNVWKRNKK